MQIGSDLLNLTFYKRSLNYNKATIKRGPQDNIAQFHRVASFILTKLNYNYLCIHVYQTSFIEKGFFFSYEV